jgi:hypothetical protein
VSPDRAERISATGDTKNEDHENHTGSEAARWSAVRSGKGR